jgi:hypothetical protein
MHRFVVALSFALVFSLLAGGTALAGTQWCVVDPVIVINGRSSDVQVAFDKANVPSLSGPVLFRFHVPSNSTATIAMPPSTVPYSVQLLYDLPAAMKRSPTTVTVDTLVGAHTVFPVQTVVEITRAVLVSVNGTSGATTTISYTLR